MKTLTTFATLLMLTAAVAHAQSETAGNTYSTSNVSPTTSRQPQTLVAHDVTGFSNPYTGPGVTQESKQRPPNIHPDLKPQPGGIATDTVKYGAVMWSPLAPESLGNGEKYLSAPSPRGDVDHETGPAAHRDSGGWKLFCLEF
jgi:hypothetical protein